MKKALIMLLLLVAVVGSFGMSQAAPPAPHDCTGNVDVLCDYDSDGDGETDTACVLWVDFTAEDPTGEIAVICQTDQPPAV